MAPPRKYSAELRERAVRMVFELREQTGEKTGTIARVADQLGVHREALRMWVRQTEVDAGKRPGTTSSDAQRLAELERENRELRRANEILKAASAFFARELDPRLPRWSSSSILTGTGSVSSRSALSWNVGRRGIGRRRNARPDHRLVRCVMNS
jgi:transposase